MFIRRVAGGSVLEVRNAPTHSFGSTDNAEPYDREHLLDCRRSEVVSRHAVVFTAPDGARWSIILGAGGGATAVHERSMLVFGEMCFVAIGPFVVALELPTLRLVWRAQVDFATCFGIHLSSDEDALITHGELELGRVSFAGEVLWAASGADIFSETIDVSAGVVRAVDFEGRRYAFDERTGQQVADSKAQDGGA